MDKKHIMKLGERYG